MANSDKNIRITTSKNKTTYPNIVFTGSAAGSSVITLEVLDDNTLSFTSNEGQVFSIDSNLSTGTIWAVSDISGIPLLSASAGGTIGLGVYGGVVGIGQTNPTYKLDLKGNFGLASSNDGLYNFIFSNSAASGSNSLQVRSANSILLYNSGNTFYTGLKSNAAANVTYTLPTTDGSVDQFLKTNGSGTLSWGTPSGGSGGGGTGVGAGGQYEVAVYPSTGSSVVGYSSLKNDVSANVVSISHSTVSTNHTNGALTVTGGAGIGGSLYVAGIGASITGVTFSNSTITRGTWNGTAIATQYGGTGQNLSSSTGILTISSGTVSASTTSSAISSALSDETGSGSLVFGTTPTFTTSVVTSDATFAVFNTNATTINAFGAATNMSIGAATGKATFNSTDNSTSSTTGGLVVSGGAGFAKSISLAGRLQLFNGANYTSFVSSASGNTVYFLPASTPATGSSVLQSDSVGNMSWVPMVASSSGAGSGTVAVPGAQFQIAAYYSGTGASVSGSTTFTNNTSTGVVNITHSTVSTSSSTGALTVSGGVGIGGSLYTSTGSSSSISGVILANNTISAGTYNKVTITAPTSSATLTLADGSSLITSGGNSLTFTTTALTNVTLPTSGTLVNTAVTSLASLTTASSLNSVGTITSGTWSATAITSFYGGTGHATYTNGDLLVGSGGTVAKLPAGTTNYVLTSNGAGAVPSWQAVPASSASSVAVIPTTLNQSFFMTAVSASSGSALGLSTVVSFVINPSTGIVSASGMAVTSTTASTSTTTGALIVSGGAGVALTLNVGGTISSIGASIYGPLYANNIQIGQGGNNINFLDASGITLGNFNTSNGWFRSAQTTNSSSTSTGALVSAGGLGIASNAFIGGTVNITSSQTSIATNNGALVVTGGVGIGGSLYTSAGSTSSVSGVLLANGNISASTYNKLTLTSPATSATLTLANGSSLITSGANSLTFTTTSTTSVTLPTAGTLTTTGNDLSVFAATTSLQLKNLISDETGSGALVFANTPTLVTPDIGVATATSVNKVAITAPATSATLTLANGSTLATSGAFSLTFTTTANSSLTVPNAGTLTTTGNKLSDFAATTSAELLGVISDETGSGKLVFATSPDLTTSLTTASATFALLNTGATTLNAFGAATVMSIGAATGKATFNSTDNSTSTTTGGLVVSGGAGIAKSLSVGGALQMFNGANFTAFISAATANTVYTLPTTSPATGSSVLQSTSAGVMSWVPMTSGGSPSGTINSSTVNNIAYYSASTTLSGDNIASGNYFLYNGTTNGLNIAHVDNETLPSANTGLLRIGTGATNYAVRKALAVISTNLTWTDGDLLVLGVGKNVADTRVGIDWRGYIQIGVPGTGFTLPVSNGTSGQVLTANTNGVASWTTVSSSGAGSGTVAVPGAQYQVAAYYHSATGASVSGSTTFTNNTATGVVNITHTTESTSTTTGALTVSGGAGIAKTASVGQVKVGTLGYAATNVLSAFQSSVGGSNKFIVQNTNSGASASANIIVNNNLGTDSTYFGEFGMNSSAFTGSGALSAPNAVYLASATGPLVLGTVTSHPIRFVVNNGATDVMYIAESGTAISVFTNLGLRSASDLRFWNSGNTFYAGIQGGNNTANYLLTMPTAPVGVGYSTIIVDSSGNMYFVPLTGGLAATSATGNQPAFRKKMDHHIWFCGGYTPTIAGADPVIFRVPDSSVDGTTRVTFFIEEFSIRVETPSSGSSRIQVEKSSLGSTGAFTLAATGSSLIGGLGLTISGAGTYITTFDSFTAGVLVTSGDVLRLNWTLLNATHANFSVQLTIQEV